MGFCRYSPIFIALFSPKFYDFIISHIKSTYFTIRNNNSVYVYCVLRSESDSSASRKIWYIQKLRLSITLMRIELFKILRDLQTSLLCLFGTDITKFQI